MLNGYVVLLTVFVGILIVAPSDSSAQTAKRVKDRNYAIISKDRPKVPDRARGIRGYVLLRVELRGDGKVGEIECINPDDENRRMVDEAGLIDATIAAARKLKFRPRIVNGEAVTVLISLPHYFNW